MIKSGENLGVADNLFVGQQNYNLSEKGIKDATDVANTIKSYDVDYVFCSSSQQARDTWDIVSDSAVFLAHKRPSLCPQLQDRSGGVLEGLNWTAIRKMLPPRKYKLWERDFTEYPEMGESLLDVEDRVTRFLKYQVAPLLAEGKTNNVVLIADGVVINLIIKRLQKLTDNETFSIGAQASVPYFYHGSLNL